MDDLRRELAYRPLVLAAAALALGLTAVLHPANLLLLLPLIWPRRPVPVALAFVLGLTLAPRPVPVLPAALRVAGEATVLSVPQEESYGLVTDVRIDGHRWRAVLPQGARVTRGELWQIEGLARPLGEAADFGRFRGIEGRLKPDRATKIAEAPFVWRLADGWRRSYVAFVDRSLPPVAAQWLEAFAFRVDTLDDSSQDALNRTGTVHLVAASGIHVAALGLVGMALGRLFGAPRGVTLGLVFAGLVLYAMATGLHLPTLRAALAFAVGSSAYLVRREPDGPSALALAVLAYLPFDPAAVYGIGFQLSILVVGMLVLRPHFRREPARTAAAWWGQKASELGAISLIASLAAAPLVAQREGSVALTSVPANVLAVPPVLASVVASLVLHPLHAGWAMPAVGGLVLFARAAIEWADALPAASLAVPPFSPYLLVPIYGAWMWFWRPRARPA